MKKKKRRSLEVGDLVLDGRYEITSIIHTSGMANVYSVLDKNLNKRWCLKEIVKSEAGKENIEYYSLLQEANILKNLNNSNIPRIVTIEEEDDSIFIVMDFIEGTSVKTYLVNNGVVKQQLAVKWAKQICGIMIYLHNRKEPIFYRDMKPDNIMIQEDGNVKLIDFGVSVAISENNKYIKKRLGTPGFAAPEQRKVGAPYDLRSDIYAFGRTLYYMLTGINPSLVKGKLKSIREVDSSLSIGLEKVVLNCIEEDPDKRYESMEHVLYALNNYEKYDTDYIKKSKRKIKITGSLFATSILLFASSFIPLGMHNARLDEEYKDKVAVAAQTNRTSDYLDAVSLKPLILDPYTGLIDTFKQDGVFSKEEEESLLNVINPNLVEMKKDKDYGQLAYNMGKLYWYYYEGNDGDVVSSKWFEEAINSGFKEEDAKVYYDLSNFKKNISMAITESDDSGMYKEYWDNLMSAKKIDSGEMIELQIYNYIADSISTYSYRLKSDGVSKEELMREIDNIEKFLEASNPVSDKSKELKERLANSSSDLRSKVEAAYSHGGE